MWLIIDLGSGKSRREDEKQRPRGIGGPDRTGWTQPLLILSSPAPRHFFLLPARRAAGGLRGGGAVRPSR